MRARHLVAAVAALALVRSTLSAQTIDLDQISANEEFRWGVVALNAGRVTEAIASLNRSLSFDPARPLTRYWLARAYYYAGFTQAALEEWRGVARSEGRSAILATWIERTELAYGLEQERLGHEVAPGRYVTMASVPAVSSGLTLFRRPTTVSPRSDGYFYVAAFGSDAVVLMDPNGVRRQVIDGGLEGLDRPFDVVELADGSLLVSEFAANRIARISDRGFKIGSFGTRGTGASQLLGPQYLALDGKGHVYVSDYGNSRIAKYTTDGEFLFTFGGRSTGFPGLRAPAGLVVHADRVYVADSEQKRIYVFDESGNHRGELVTPTIDKPEALSLYSAGRLLVTSNHTLHVVDLGTGVVSQIGELAARSRLTGAAVDANGNLLACDFAGESIVMMSASEEIYRGLNVEVGTVVSADHPTVLATVTVTDRSGRPVLGLDETNFRVTEGRFPTGVPELVYSASRALDVAVALVVDRSAGMVRSLADIDRAAADILGALSPLDRAWVVGAGSPSLVESVPGDGLLRARAAAVGLAGDYGAGHLDAGLRLAAAQLLDQHGSRTVVVVSNGSIDRGAFDRYTLAETGRFLANNHIRLSVVYTARNVASAELDHLVEVTGGTAVYLHQPAGAGVLVDEARRRPAGTYLLRFRSVHDADFGRRYIPLEVEVYLLQRSGRDEAGYFGPLVF